MKTDSRPRSFASGTPLLIFLLIASVGDCLAQSTSFTYQGKLSTAGNPASGSYDMQFKLFDTEADMKNAKRMKLKSGVETTLRKP